MKIKEVNLRNVNP